MKILLHGKNAKNIDALVKSIAFEIVNKNPDVIVSFGGDGTLLSSEREYPGIPKLPIRNSQFCNKCPEHADKVLLEKLQTGKLNLREYSKLETEIDGKKLIALNDFVIRNKEPIHTIRFKTTPRHPERSEGSLLIGDGIVISTSFGSSGYFKSITGKTFDESLPAGRQGFGLAFNNTTQKMEPQFFGTDDQLIFQLVRGKAGLSFDNNPEVYNLLEGIEITFKLSNQVARFYELESLRCPNCEVIRT